MTNRQLLAASLLLAIFSVLPASAAEWTVADPDQLPARPANALGYPSRDPQLDAWPGFQNPPPGYGEVPFWWWTGDPLDKDRLLWQIEELHKKGISGMQVNYAHEDTPGWLTYAAAPEIFSDEWWDMWKFVAGQCSRRGMGIGLSGYTLDWPNGRSLISRTIYEPEIQGRKLAVARKERVAAGHTAAFDLPADTVAVRAYAMGRPGRSQSELPLGPKSTPNGSTRPDNSVRTPDGSSGGLDLAKSVTNERLTWTPTEGDWQVWVFTAARKPGTLNPIHPLAGQRVVEKFFQPFQDHAPERSAAGLNYFFHDELHFGVGDRVWSEDLAAAFRTRKGYDLFEALPALFQDAGPKTAKYRLDYMDVKMQLVQERYFVPIFQWHWTRGKVYGCDQGSRGRNPLEFGDYFGCVRWYTAPGHDTPGGNADLIKGKVSSSIAHLYRRPRVWLEGYHSLGWGATPENLMFATRENYLYGCNLLNLHGLYYSTHGSFWEWAPPCYHFRMPYWGHMGTFLKYFERLSYLMSQGAHQCEIAVLYPVSPGQAQLGGHEATETAFAAGTTLFQNGYDFVFLDDESLVRSQLREGRLHVSDAAYRVLVLPALRAVRWSTLQKALEFQRAGGVVLAVGALPEASDRAGSHDPVLDAAVKELFGTTAAEAKAGARPPAQKTAAGGVSAALLGGAEMPVRRYDGGFAGAWAWSKEPVQNVYLKALWRASAEMPQACRVRFFCDNEGALYVNGKQLCAGADYTHGWTGEVTLKNGDVITVDARDHDPPGRRRTAGLFLAIVRDGKAILSTLDLRYTLARPSDDKWRTEPALAGLSVLDPTNVHEAHLGTAGSNAVGALLDTVQRLVPRDVQAPKPVRAVHRRIGPRDVYLVMGAAKGSDCTFRATGRAELWDPWTGTARPLHVVAQERGGATLRMPLEAYEAQVVVFTPGEPELVVPATSLAEVTKVAVVRGKATVTGYAAEPGPQTATIKRGGRIVALQGTAAAVPAPLALDGDWEFALQPTMDNRWGDFRLPATERMIGAEARTFRYAEETAANPGSATLECDNLPPFSFSKRAGTVETSWVATGVAERPMRTKSQSGDKSPHSKGPAGWQSPDFDDSRWPRITHGFGLKFWKLGPLPRDVDPAALDTKLATLPAVDPTVPVAIGGQRYPWSPYAFSWRWGVEGDPGHQGWHGLKENVSDDFIRLGKPKSGRNETLYVAEEAGTRYYLWAAAVAPQALQAKVLCGGEVKPAAVYVNGKAVAAGADRVELQAGANPLLLRYDAPGRGHFVLASATAVAPPARTPLSMTWYDHPGLVPLDARPAVARPAGWYRFVAPPGLRGMTLTAQGIVQAWADGRPLNVTSEPRTTSGAMRFRLTCGSPLSGKSTVALRIEPPRGAYGGAAIPEPIQLDCGNGTTALGDWSQGSALECYSGGAWYRRNVTLSPEQVRRRVVLNLGEVVATAEVRVNGGAAGIRVAPPWTLDISQLVKAGDNRVEILVYNTLANHYRTIPTRYRGNPKSGLLGPVRLEFVEEVTLSE